MGANSPALLPLVVDHGDRFILIGGGAATVHGSARLTLDVDVVYVRDPDNSQRLATVLSPHQP